MKRLAVVMCAVVMALGLFACSGGSSSGAATSASSAGSSAGASAASANLQNYGWVSFEMPDGWADANESDKYETIADQENNRRMMKIMLNTLTSSNPTAADLAAKDIASTAHDYKDAGKKTIGGFEWSLASFEFNGNPSFVAYANATDDRCLKVTVYEMDIDDPAAQTVLGSISVNKDKLW